MEYLLKASALLVIFYLCYIMFLQRETFFQHNRWFLLTGIIASLTLPFVVIPIYIEYTPVAVDMIEATTGSSGAATTIVEKKPFDWFALLIQVYSIGVLVLVTRCIIQFFSLSKIISKGNAENVGSFKLLKSDNNIAPFSFFNWIVINPNQFNKSELEQVLTHEKAHASELHSLDIILIELATIILWFNPFIWLYSKSMKQNLEFIADKKTQKASPCVKSYQTLLLKQSIPNYNVVLANNFYNSLIKKRIIMLNKHQSKKWNRIKLLVVLPLLSLFLYSFNTETRYTAHFEESVNHNNELYNDLLEVIITKDTSEDDLKKMRDELYDQGIKMTIHLIERNADNVITKIDVSFETENGEANYSKKGETGIVDFYFKVDEDGTFGVGPLHNEFEFKHEDHNTSPKKLKHTDKVHQDILEDSHKDHDVYVESQNSTVTQKTTISADTVFYEINTTGNKKQYIVTDSIKTGNVVLRGYEVNSNNTNNYKIRQKSDSNYLFTTDGEKQPIVIVDGKYVDQIPSQGFNYNYIKTIDVIKDDEAKKIYGNRAENGVIVVTTTNGKASVVRDSDVKIRANNLPASESLVYITKNTSSTDLDRYTAQLEEKGLFVKLSKVKRNKQNEITKIKISLRDKNGNLSSATFANDNGIVPVKFGKSNGTLIVNSNTK